MPKLIKNLEAGVGARIVADVYPTPQLFVEACVVFGLASKIVNHNVSSVLDIGTGDGRWLKVYDYYGASYWSDTQLKGVDIRPEAEQDFTATMRTLTNTRFLLTSFELSDFTYGLSPKNIASVRQEILSTGEHDLVLGNPPFKYATEAMIYGYAKTKDVMMMLLPTEFIHSAGRATLFDQLGMRPNVMVTLPRLDFTQQGKPHTVCSLFIWRKDTQPHYTKVVAFPQHQFPVSNEWGYSWELPEGKPAYSVLAMREYCKPMFNSLT